MNKEISELAESIKKVHDTLPESAAAGLNALLKSDKINPAPYVPPTMRTAATVRIMLSYDFCHFEESITLTGENISLPDIDQARKDVQRLCDKAVGQYKTAKEIASKKTQNPTERQILANEVAELRKLKEEYLTPAEKAKIKAYDDYVHHSRYNYDDDQEYNFPMELVH